MSTSDVGRGSRMRLLEEGRGRVVVRLDLGRRQIDVVGFCALVKIDLPQNDPPERSEFPLKLLL